MPIVMISANAKPEHPTVQQKRAYSEAHYRIAISPACKVIEIVNAWLETLADAKAIPREGGEQSYAWFFRGLEISPENLSPKARHFLNMFATQD